jgi:hypothetical protein
LWVSPCTAVGFFVLGLLYLYSLWELPLPTQHIALKILPYPTSNASDATRRCIGDNRLSLSDGVMLLREGEQTRSCGKCWPACGIRESGETQRPAGAHLLVENRARNFGHAIELAAAADQNGASAGQLIHT